MFTLRESQKGFSAFAMTLVILASVGVMAVVSSNQMTSRQESITSSFDQHNAFTVAQAGLDYAIPYLNENREALTDGATTSVVLPNGARFTLTFQFLDGKDLVRVVSSGVTASGLAENELSQTVQYIGENQTVTFPRAVIARDKLYMKNNARVTDTTGSLYSAKLGSGATLQNNAKTVLDSGTASSSGSGGADILSYDTVLSSLTDDALVENYLERDIADFQNEDTQITLPSQLGVHSYKDDLDNLEGMSIGINHSLGVAKFDSNGKLGSSDSPIVLVVNLSNNAAFSVEDNADVYGKIVVNDGSAEVKNNAKIYGDVIVDGNLTIGNNAYIEGDIVATGDVLLENNAKVKGAVFALGDVDINNNAEIHGAVLAGGSDGVELRNNAKIIYDTDYAKINLPKSSAQSAATVGYGRVSGSWTDMAAN